MPRCFLLAVCTSSALDQGSNTFSLFRLVEEIEITSEIPPTTRAQNRATVPLEIHSYFEFSPDEVNRDFQVRWLVPTDSGDIDTTFEGTLRSPTSRFRVRAMNLTIPIEPGTYHLYLEWRFVGSETWNRDAYFWPLVIRFPVSPLTTPAQGV
jgi:hypothetical protein